MRGIDFATGSLGHGLSIAVGATLAARFERSSRRVFALLSDAECNEGSVWEAAMFAAHHRLAALTAIIDLNGQQALGHTAEVLSLAPMAEKWRAFGWACREIDGHDHDAIAAALSSVPHEVGKPTAIVAHTVKGKGVSFMENLLAWHYKSPSDEQLAQALAEVEAEAEQEKPQ